MSTPLPSPLPTSTSSAQGVIFFDSILDFTFNGKFEQRDYMRSVQQAREDGKFTYPLVADLLQAIGGLEFRHPRGVRRFAPCMSNGAPEFSRREDGRGVGAIGPLTTTLAGVRMHGRCCRVELMEVNPFPTHFINSAVHRDIGADTGLYPTHPLTRVYFVATEYRWQELPRAVPWTWIRRYRKTDGPTPMACDDVAMLTVIEHKPSIVVFRQIQDEPVEDEYLLGRAWPEDESRLGAYSMRLYDLDPISTSMDLMLKIWTCSQKGILPFYGQERIPILPDNGTATNCLWGPQRMAQYTLPCYEWRELPFMLIDPLYVLRWAMVYATRLPDQPIFLGDLPEYFNILIARLEDDEISANEPLFIQQLTPRERVMLLAEARKIDALFGSMPDKFRAQWCVRSNPAVVYYQGKTLAETAMIHCALYAYDESRGGQASHVFPTSYGALVACPDGSHHPLQEFSSPHSFYPTTRFSRLLISERTKSRLPQVLS